MRYIIDNMRSTRIARSLVMFCALVCAVIASAQTTPNYVTGQQYNTTYNNTTLYNQDNSSQGVSVTHKYAKWYDLRTSGTTYDDAFDDDENSKWVTLANGTQIQNTHTVVDTIYMYRGDKTTLKIYDVNAGVTTGTSGNINNKTYQRWFNYETDGLFDCEIDSTYTTREWVSTGTRPWQGSYQNVEHTVTAYDFLTPTENSSTYFYKFKNGYVGMPLNSTRNFYSAEFYFPTKAQQANIGDGTVKNEYIVACDVSGYNDFFSSAYTTTTTGSFSSTYCEPTLSHRYIYHIIALDDVTPTYNDMHITFPATRYRGNTSEMVALPLDARSYVGNSSDPVTVTLGTTNEAGIKLLSGNNGDTITSVTLSGDSRIIYFLYPNSNGDGTWSVNNKYTKPESQILVKTGGASGTTVMTFYLTFDEEARLLSQSQVKKMNSINKGTATATDGGVLSAYLHRDPAYIKENLDLLTDLNFDFDTSVGSAYGQEQYYTFPLGWDDMSAAFYDGSSTTVTTITNGYSIATKSCPEWGYYGITSAYVETDSEGWGSESNVPQPDDSDSIRYNSNDEQSTYHLFVDTSNRPERFARLPFEENLCGGTELYVTAWVKCTTWKLKGAGDDGSVQCNAGAMFSIMGVTDNLDGTKTYTPVYRYQTGQIPYTCATSDNNKAITCEGYDNSKNDWVQVYFSFINTTNEDYGSYVLEVDNASASANGADLYVDDIRIYTGHANATVKQLNASCAGERTMMSMSFDWDRLTSRLGIDTEDASTGDYTAVDYCFLDKSAYENYLIDHSGETDVVKNAIAAAVVPFSDGENDAEDTYKEYNTFYFYNIFAENTEYDANDHPQLARDNQDTNGNDFVYRTTDALGTNSLIVDFYGTFSVNKTYWVLVEPRTSTSAATPTAATFAEIDVLSSCAIKTAFSVTSQFIVRVNGEVLDPETEYCTGQVLNFPVQVRVPTSTDSTGLEIYETLTEGIYYDWFMGTEAEYLAKNASYDNTSLRQALVTFRDILEYQSKTTLDGVVAGTYDGIGETGTVTLTTDMINLINYYLNEPDTECGQAARLVLRQSSLNITIQSDSLFLVVQPIPTQSLADEDDTYEWENICWNYIPIVLTATGSAPSLYAGFSDVVYPTDSYSPSFRIGLDQIEKTSATNEITLSLRKATLAGITGEDVDHIGLVSGGAYDKLFLISTDDPAYANYFPESTDDAYDMYSMPIGVVTSLYATEGDNASQNQVQFYFDTTTEQDNGFKFTPHEGFTYTFAIYFQEYLNAEGTEIGSSCYGMFNVPMKVVPKYVVWQGTDGTANWNNDANWKRADKAELLKTDDDTYDTNATNGTSNGFVPMLFSNVVMPQDSRAQLYMAGFDAAGEWIDVDIPTDMETIADGTQYDFMVYEDASGALSTQNYRVNICNDIHFEQGAQMLHAEQLIYGTAWMDIPVTNNRWVAISTPLQDVVAGDWYTQSTGAQATEYFQPITFTTDYSRINPAVFQRSWADAATILTTSDDATGRVVSHTATWSATYNDASVAYSAGAGYSIRGWQPNYTSLLFRLPKADTSYDYSTATSDLSRTNNGKLLISNMVDRSDPDSDCDATTYAQGPVTVTLSAANGDDSYFMVGNPYMAPLDVQAFMEGNSTALLQQYMYVDATTGALTTVTYADGAWSADKTYIDPYAVFYVKAASESATSVDVVFTTAMQAFAPATTTTAKAARTLAITATSDSGTGVATLSYSTAATNAYDRQEDAELISGLGEGDAPQVFTTADNTAISANQLRDMTCIPLGVYADDDEVVTLTFDNVDAVADAQLYDATLMTTTPLHDGYALQLSGSSYGRYFLITSGRATAINSVGSGAETSGDDAVLVSSMMPRQVVVTSDRGIRDVTVWSTSGAVIRRQQCDGAQVCTLDDVTSGAAVVSVTTNDGTVTKTLVVR